MHNIAKYTILTSLLMMTSCALSKQEKRAQFEAKLDAKIGTMTQDIIKEHGHPTKYSNTSPLDDNAMGSFMIYDYTNQGDDCILVYKYSKKTLKILDWHYTGSCMDKE